jgi:hypothetical protein
VTVCLAIVCDAIACCQFPDAVLNEILKLRPPNAVLLSTGALPLRLPLLPYMAILAVPWAMICERAKLLSTSMRHTPHSASFTRLVVTVARLQLVDVCTLLPEISKQQGSGNDIANA